MKPLVTVVIPNFNCGNYLTRCLDSIFSQAVNFDFNVIVVDDGSTDDSLTVLSQYEHSSDLTIIKQSNSGVSSARNAGIENAQGSYITFVDADDTLCEGSLQLMVDNINDSDFISYSYQNIKTDSSVVIQHQIDGTYSGKTFHDNLFFFANRIVFAPHAKLISHEFLQNSNVRFPQDISTGEDFIFCMKLFTKANKFTIVDSPVYNYCENSSSVTHQFSYDLWKNQSRMIQEVYSLNPPDSKYELEFIVKRMLGVYKTYFPVCGKTETIDILNKYWTSCYGDKYISCHSGRFLYKIPIYLCVHNSFSLVVSYFSVIDSLLRLKHLFLRRISK